MDLRKGVEEIEEFIEKVREAVDNPKCSGMTYEEGVLAALEWVLGEVPEDEPII